MVPSGIDGFAGDWPGLRGQNQDGVSSERIQVQLPPDGPKLLWRVPTTGGFSSFAIAEGKAFTLVTRTNDGRPSEICLALDAASGKELWATPVGAAKYPGGGDSGTPENRGGDGPRTTPTVAGGRVFTYSSDLKLTCLDARDGKIQWRKDVATEFDGQNISWQNAMSPAVAGDALLLAGGGKGQAMLALKQASGELLWKAGDDKMTHTSPIVATLQGVRQAIFFMQSGLVARALDDGRELWRFPFPFRTATACMPVIGGDLVFCSAGYDIGAAACRVAKGADGFSANQAWFVRGKPLGSIWSPPVQKDGFLYGLISAKQYGAGPLKCVELKTGEVKWEQRGFGNGNVLLAANCLVVLSDDGRIVLVDPTPAAYKELASFKAVAGKCWTTPALADGKLYVRSTREGACFDLSTAVR